MSGKEHADCELGEYASPPCFMHELTPHFRAQTNRSDAWTDVARWRKAERKRLIEQRLATGAEQRKEKSNHIARLLDRAIGKVGGRIVSSYWPFRGEPDLRNWGIRLIERGGRIALPVVLRKDRPLEFRIWSPGDPLERGVWNILVPARGPAVQPDIVVAPVVGFDSENYRLGYGGGFFDRTLAAMAIKPMILGVGYADSKLATIYPQPHDIAMDAIITD